MKELVVEIRSYLLEPGTRDVFHRLVSSQSVPLLRQFGIDVVGFGASLHDADSYYLVRAYRDLDDLDSSHERFYGSAAWKEGPRTSIVGLILKDVDAVFRAEEPVVDALRAAFAPRSNERG